MLQSVELPDLQLTPEAEQRSKLIMWIVMLMSVGAYYLVARMVPPPQVAPNPILFPVFLALACINAGGSFALKALFEARARRENRPALRRTGFLIALVLCETAALYGVVIWFLTASPYYYVLLLIGGVAMLLHFPGRTIE